jgi:lysozyme family protein
VSLASLQARDPVAAWSIQRTLKLEGGLADSAADPGGVTNFGISLRWALAEIGADPQTARFLDVDHDGHVDRKDIIGLTSDEAADGYFACWWSPGWYASLAPRLVAWKTFDIAVNTGPKRSGLILQKALCAVGEAVAVDAQVGPKTQAAVARQAAKDQAAALLVAIRAEQKHFYERLCVLNPDLVTFKKGWLRRAAL